jgi:hypothetical protein
MAKSDYQPRRVSLYLRPSVRLSFTTEQIGTEESYFRDIRY